MTPTVHLHIGEPKSGTTYLQAVLEENRASLETDGWLLAKPRQQIRAAQDLIRDHGAGGGWREMATSLLEWRGTDVLVSMETLCRADPDAAASAISAFGQADVRVYVTVRDVARTLPAQWQQTTQHSKTWTFAEYVDGVTQSGPRSPVARNFWSQHDLAKTLTRWTKPLAADHVTVITVPGRGGDPNLLWQRFAGALGLRAERYRTVRPANESLGAASAELLRRVNVQLETTQLSKQQYNSLVRGVLARDVLAARRDVEQKVALPVSTQPWAEREAQRLIDAVTSSGVQVVGELDDLRPVIDDLAPQLADVSEPEVAAAAVSAVLGLIEQMAAGRRSNQL